MIEPERARRRLTSAPVSPSVALGLLLALCCSVVALLGFLFKQRGAVGAPAVQWRHPVRSTVALFANRWWTLGILVATRRLGVPRRRAVAGADQPRAVGHRGRPCAADAAGRAASSACRRRGATGSASASPPPGWRCWPRRSATRATSAHRDFDGADAVALRRGPHRRRARRCCRGRSATRRRAGPVLALAAGPPVGRQRRDDQGRVRRPDRPLAARALHARGRDDHGPVAVGLVVCARSLQLGPAVAVIAITSAAANVVTIAAGPIVFSEPLPDGTRRARRPAGRLHGGDRRRRPHAGAGGRGGARTPAPEPAPA